MLQKKYISEITYHNFAKTCRNHCEQIGHTKPLFFCNLYGPSSNSPAARRFVEVVVILARPLKSRSSTLSREPDALRYMYNIFRTNVNFHIVNIRFPHTIHPNHRLREKLLHSNSPAKHARKETIPNQDSRTLVMQQSCRGSFPAVSNLKHFFKTYTNCALVYRSKIKFAEFCTVLRET